MDKKILSLINLILFICPTLVLAANVTSNPVPPDPVFGGMIQRVNLPNLIGPNTICAFVVNITNAILGFVGIIAVLMFLWAGILYLTSRGDVSQIQRANDVVKYAVIGAAFALLGTGLVQIILSIIGGRASAC